MKRLILVLGIVAGLTAPALGGFIPGSLQIDPCDPQPWPDDGPGNGNGPPDWAKGNGPPPWAGTPAWSRDPNWQSQLRGDRNEFAEVHITEGIGGGGLYPLDFYIEADEDPIIEIDKDVLNDSNFTWTGYVITLETSSGASLVSGSADSDIFSVDSESTDTIVFTSPGSVAPGQTVRVSFDINIPSAGGFDFTITQAPTPEPGALAMVALGGIGVLLRRRRRRR